MPLGRRRRPLARAAMVGGGAYALGKHNANSNAHEAEQDAQLADAQQQQAYAAPPPPPPPPPAYAPPAPAPAAPAADVDVVGQLQGLKSLLDSGVLTQAEFDAQKQKVLGE